MGLAVLLIGIAMGWLVPPLSDWVQSLIGWFRERGALGTALFMIGYIVLVVALAPAELMSIIAGLIFGAWGFPLVAVSATVGAALTFLVSRPLGAH